MVKLFMRNGRPTTFLLLLPIEARKRALRICKALGRREFNKMLREWSYNETVELRRYDKANVRKDGGAATPPG